MPFPQDKNPVSVFGGLISDRHDGCVPFLDSRVRGNDRAVWRTRGAIEALATLFMCRDNLSPTLP
jgi:hypothetical protein